MESERSRTKSLARSRTVVGSTHPRSVTDCFSEIDQATSTQQLDALLEVEGRGGEKAGDLPETDQLAQWMDRVNGIHPAPDIHEHFMIYKGYGTLRISSRTTSTILSAQ